MTIAVRLPKYKPDFDQSVTYLISESRGMAMRKARILATIPEPLPIPEEGIASDSELEPEIVDENVQNEER